MSKIEENEDFLKFIDNIDKKMIVQIITIEQIIFSRQIEKSQKTKKKNIIEKSKNQKHMVYFMSKNKIIILLSNDFEKKTSNNCYFDFSNI